MAGTSIVQRALNNRWLTERGVPSLKQQWIEMHYGKQNAQFNPAAVNLTGTAWSGPVCQACPAIAWAAADGVGGGRAILPATRLGAKRIIRSTV